MEKCCFQLSGWVTSGLLPQPDANLVWPLSLGTRGPLLMSFCHFVPWRASHLLRLIFFVQGGKKRYRRRRRWNESPPGVWKCQIGDRNFFSPFFCWWITIPFSLLLSSQDYQHGIFQSIGFKEFHDYLTVPEGSTQQEKDLLRDKGQIRTWSVSQRRI